MVAGECAHSDAALQAEKTFKALCPEDKEGTKEEAKQETKHITDKSLLAMGQLADILQARRAP